MGGSVAGASSYGLSKASFFSGSRSNMYSGSRRGLHSESKSKIPIHQIIDDNGNDVTPKPLIQSEQAIGRPVK